MATQYTHGVAMLYNRPGAGLAANRKVLEHNPGKWHPTFTTGACLNYFRATHF